MQRCQRSRTVLIRDLQKNLHVCCARLAATQTCEMRTVHLVCCTCAVHAWCAVLSASCCPAGRCLHGWQDGRSATCLIPCWWLRKGLSVGAGQPLQVLTACCLLQRLCNAMHVSKSVHCEGRRALYFGVGKGDRGSVSTSCMYLSDCCLLCWLWVSWVSQQHAEVAGLHARPAATAQGLYNCLPISKCCNCGCGAVIACLIAATRINQGTTKTQLGPSAEQTHRG